MKAFKMAGLCCFLKLPVSGHHSLSPPWRRGGADMRESPSRLRLSVPRSPQCRTPGSRRRPAAPPRFIYQQRPASTRRWSRGSRGGGPGHMGARAAPEGANNGAGRAPAAPTKGLRGTKPLSRTGAFGCFCHIQKNNNKKKKTQVRG